MSIASIVALLQAALMLLTLVGAHPELPQSARDNATQVAQQAISQATQALASQSTQGSQSSVSQSNTSKDVTVNFFRISATSNNTNPVLEWSTSNVSFDSCTIFRHTTRPQGASGIPDKTYNVKANGTLPVVNGYFYRLMCSGSHNGENATTQNDVDLLSAGGGTNISVSGMSKYTDSDFGFSFWYPSGWTVREDVAHGTVKMLIVSNGTQSLHLLKISSPGGRVSTGVAKYESGIYFNAGTHTWMDYTTGDLEKGVAGATEHSADVSQNTMGGLHVIHGIVPLSAHNFIQQDPDIDWGPGELKASPLLKTIVAADVFVATPVSAAEQQATIQAEKDSYVGL